MIQQSKERNLGESQVIRVYYEINEPSSFKIVDYDSSKVGISNSNFINSNFLIKTILNFKNEIKEVNRAQIFRLRLGFAQKLKAKIRPK